MSEKEITKRYSNEELTVVWKPEKCIHAGICVKTLPEVYNPEEKPWIKATKASAEELKTQIDLCPSGALTYEVKGATARASEQTSEMVVRVKANGPLFLEGNFKIVLADGSVEKETSRTALCRCGHSKNKPYCDGSHKAMDFKG